MSDQINQRVTVGRLGAPHGVKGWMRLQSFTDPARNILDYQPWQVNVKNNWQAVVIEEVRLHGKSYVIKLKNCDDRNQALLFTNAFIAVTREKLPKLASDEFYWSDFVGLTVINQNQVVLGRVDHLHATGSNDVLIVKGEKEHWIPYLPGRYVLSVDMSSKTILVDWDENF